MIQDGEITAAKGRIESMDEEDGDDARSVELVDADIGTLLTGAPHLIETMNKEGDRIVVQLTNLGEMGEDTPYPGMQAAYN